MRWWSGVLAALGVGASAHVGAQTGAADALAPEEATMAYCQGVESARILAFEQVAANACGSNKMKQTCASTKALSERSSLEAARRRDFLESSLREKGVMSISWVGSRGPLVGGQALAFSLLGSFDLLACHDFSTTGLPGIARTTKEESCEHLKSCREAYATDL
jgi:hypothetical protein